MSNNSDAVVVAKATNNDVVTENSTKDKQHIIDDIYLFCNSITDSLMKAQDESFLVIKLLLLFNNVCSIPFENINAYMSMFFDKTKYCVNKPSGALVYSNPIHVCALLTHAADDRVCRDTIGTMLSELNIIPCNYPIMFRNKQDIIFYASLFGATTEQLQLIRCLLQIAQSRTDKIELPYFATNAIDTFTHDTSDAEVASNLFTDFISIKYNNNTNKLANSNFINTYSSNYSLPVVDYNHVTHLALLAETSRSPPNTYELLKKSLKVTMKILANDNIDLTSCIQNVDDSDDTPDCNMKRICKNMYAKQLFMLNPVFRMRSLDRHSFVEMLEKPQRCYDIIANNVINSKRDVMMSLDKKQMYTVSCSTTAADKPLLVQFLQTPPNPVQLAHNFRTLMGHLHEYVNMERVEQV